MTDPMTPEALNQIRQSAAAFMNIDGDGWSNDTVLRLLAEVDRLAAEFGKANARWHDERRLCAAAEAERDDLRAQLQRQAADELTRMDELVEIEAAVHAARHEALAERDRARDVARQIAHQHIVELGFDPCDDNAELFGFLDVLPDWLTTTTEEN